MTPPCRRKRTKGRMCIDRHHPPRSGRRRGPRRRPGRHGRGARRRPAAMSGKRLLITGGAGFLGYYLSRCRLPGTTRIPASRRSRSPSSTTTSAASRAGWRSSGAASDVELVVHDMRVRCPTDMGDFDYIVHAAGIASPTYYRAHPIETMDANINGLRTCSTTPGSARTRAGRLEGFLFFSSSEIYGDPVRRRDPHPRDLPGQRLLHRPARLLRRVQAVRRDAVRQLRPAARHPGHHGAPVQQLRPGNEDHRRPRHRRPFAATSSPAATS